MSAAKQDVTVGFIGLGSIGLPMARRIAAAGWRVTGFDIRPVAVDSGIVMASSPAEVGNQSDIVLSCLTSAEVHREAILGTHGVASGSRVRHYVHLGTSGVQLVRDLAAALQGRGIAMLDAPISGGTPRARDGTLTAMASGARATFDLARPIMAAYANKIVFLSEQVGAGQLMKIVNNAMSLTNLAIAAEAFVLGAKAGLDAEAMVDIVNASSGHNSATLSKVPNFVLTRSFDFGGAMEIGIKDLKAYLAESETLSVPTELGRCVLGMFERAAAAGSMKDDVTRLFCHLETLAGTTFGGTRDPK